MRYINPPEQNTDPKVLLKLLQKELKATTTHLDSITVKVPLRSKPKCKVRPTLYITNIAEAKMKSIVAVTTREVAWHGLITRHEDTYILQDVILYPQEVTGATVESTDDYPMWLMDLDDETFELCKFQGHSHVNMGVNPSGTDLAFYEDIIMQKPEFYVFFILNKRNDYWINIIDTERNIIFETKDINIIFEMDKWTADSFKEYVKDKTQDFRDTHIINGGRYY